MGLQNFTNNKDDTPPSGSNNPPLPPGVSFSISPNGNQPSDDDFIEEMLINYNQKFIQAEPTQFRDRLIEHVLSILIGNTKPNALLVGSAGVGKTKIVEDIARRIALGDVLIPDQLKNHTIFELPISNLVAGSSLVGALEEKVKAIVDFASDPKNNVILFMDELHQLTSGSDGGTYGKIAQILKPAMARGDMQIIGATTTQEVRSLDDDPAFKRRFSHVVVDEITPEQTTTVLKTLRPSFLAHYQHQITVTDDILELVVQVADQNSHLGSHRPDNAITLLDRAMADRVLEQKQLISTAVAQKDTASAQALKAIKNFPLTESRVVNVAQRMLTGHATKHSVDWMALHKLLSDRIQGQDELHNTLVSSLHREEFDLFPRTTPIAWMFAGASGVGKTETAKIIAEQFTAQEPIILNMTEFHHESSISRIIGAPPGYIGSSSNAELPFDSLDSNPFRVILLDEFEKADRAVQRLFMQALDEGYITTARNKRVNFSKTLIIATTNAARDTLDGKTIGFGDTPNSVSQRSLNNALSQYFDTELLARFSLVLGFNPIDETTYRNTLVAQYAEQRQRIIDTKPRVGRYLPSTIPDDELDVLTQKTFDQTHGARPAKKAIKKWIEDTWINKAQVSIRIPVSPNQQNNPNSNDHNSPQESTDHANPLR